MQGVSEALIHEPAQAGFFLSVTGPQASQIWVRLASGEHCLTGGRILANSAR